MNKRLSLDDRIVLTEAQTLLKQIGEEQITRPVWLGSFDLCFRGKKVSVKKIRDRDLYPVYVVGRISPYLGLVFQLIARASVDDGTVLDIRVRAPQGEGVNAETMAANYEDYYTALQKTMKSL
jgi:hypothetical protein